MKNNINSSHNPISADSFIPDYAIIEKYFPLTPSQKEKFKKLGELYLPLNQRINLISRKDMPSFYLHHVLHSLSLGKFLSFQPGAEILDAGTGGGFPGIPLAILFPETRFHLVDSIGKKIKAVRHLAETLALDNVTTEQTRLEDHHKKYDFVVSRAVTQMDRFYKWTAKNIKEKGQHSVPNGILYLKGGDLSKELQNFPEARIYPLSDMFDEPFFETKKIVYLPVHNPSS